MKKEGKEMEKFRPVENGMLGLTGGLTRPVQWYVLVRETESLAQETGFGLGTVWQHIHKGDYEKARDGLLRFLEDKEAYELREGIEDSPSTQRLRATPGTRALLRAPTNPSHALKLSRSV